MAARAIDMANMFADDDAFRDDDDPVWIDAQPDRVMKRQLLAAQQLPELLRRVKELQKQLAAKAGA